VNASVLFGGRCRLLAAALVGLLLALTGSALSAPAAGTTAEAAGRWMLFGSSCGGAYSIRPNGSSLTPLVPRERGLRLLDVSRDGRAVAYGDYKSIYISRANGASLRRLVRHGSVPAALSRDGRLLAFWRKGIWVVRTNGRGLRRLTSGEFDESPDWSPDARALVFVRSSSTKSSVIVHPLRGKPRVLVRNADEAAWSPDGRWIAYGSNGLWLVRPDGGQRHRLVAGASTFAWAPDGRRLVFAGFSRRHGYRLGLVGVDGRALRWLRLKVRPELAVTPSWSPDGRHIAFSARLRDDPVFQIWVIGSNGRGLGRLTKGCDNGVAGWTRLAPVLPPDPPLERVLGPTTVATRDPVLDLSADGSQVAFVVQSSPAQCGHIDVWTPGTEVAAEIADFHGPRFRKGRHGKRDIAEVAAPLDRRPARARSGELETVPAAAGRQSGDRARSVLPPAR
jgi:Tol biopolymer transport system component